MTDPTTPDDEIAARKDAAATETPLEREMDAFADHLSTHQSAVSVGNALMPGFARHEQQLLSDLDAEAAADKAMLAKMPAAFHDHPPLELPGVDLAAIRSADPTFNDEAFMTVARETFYRVRDARSAEVPAEGEALLSPSMEASLRTAIDGDVASHLHHLLPFLEITSAAITAAGIADAKEVITVRFHLSGEELDRNDAGAVVGGDTTVRQWDEEWQFQRDPTVDTGATDEQHILSFSDRWMVAHRGWVVTSITRVAAG